MSPPAPPTAVSSDHQRPDPARSRHRPARVPRPQGRHRRINRYKGAAANRISDIEPENICANVARGGIFPCGCPRRRPAGLVGRSDCKGFGFAVCGVQCHSSETGCGCATGSVRPPAPCGSRSGPDHLDRVVARFELHCATPRGEHGDEWVGTVPASSSQRQHRFARVGFRSR